MDQLRYSRETHQKPVVVWNSTQRCNLHCMHCYSKSENQLYPNELTTDEAKAFVKDIIRIQSSRSIVFRRRTVAQT